MMSEEEALKALSERDLSLDVFFSETANEGYMDFARCQRADGSVYGTSGQCRQGKEVGAKEEKPKAKKSAAATEQKQEEKGYKPKEREKRQGLKGLKDRLLGGRGRGGLDSLVTSEKEVYKARDQYKQTLQDRIKNGGLSKEAKERLKKSIEAADRNAALEVSRMGTNKKFAQELKTNLPPKTKVSVDRNGAIVMTQKIGKNKIETTFSQAEGFNYTVNGGYDAGTVKDRKEQLRIAMAVRSQYDAVARSLPEKTVIKTSAYTEDGGGEARQKAYERIGFGKPDPLTGMMYSMKKNGKMVPSSDKEQMASFKNPDTVWFAEDEEDKKASIKAWFEIITGTELGGKQE